MATEVRSTANVVRLRETYRPRTSFAKGVTPNASTGFCRPYCHLRSRAPAAYSFSDSGQSLAFATSESRHSSTSCGIRSCRWFNPWSALSTHATVALAPIDPDDVDARRDVLVDLVGDAAAERWLALEHRRAAALAARE